MVVFLRKRDQKRYRTCSISNVYPNFYFLNLTAFRQNNIRLGLAASEISTKMPDYSVKAIYHDLPKTVQLVDLGVT